MKIKTFMLTMAAIFALASCSEDNLPIEYVAGKYKPTDVEFYCNGTKVELEEPISIGKIEEEAGVSSNDGLISVSIPQYVFFVNQDHRLYPKGGRSDYCMVDANILANAKSTDKQIYFEGTEELYSDGKNYSRYSVTGTYRNAKVGDTGVNISLTREVNKEGLTGKTFEMRFDEDAIIGQCGCLHYIEPLPKTGKYEQGAFDEFANLLMKNYIESTGIDAIRFTFNPDGTIDVKAHYLETGKYEDMAAHSTYQVEEYRRVFIGMDYKWIENFISQFSPRPGHSLYSWSRRYFYEKSSTTFTNAYIIGGKDGIEIYPKQSGQLIDFLNLWGHKDDSWIDEVDSYSDLWYATREDCMLDFYFNAHLVE